MNIMLSQSKQAGLLCDGLLSAADCRYQISHSVFPTVKTRPCLGQ